MLSNTDNLIWIDLEMTGLHPVMDRILEIATVVTNTALEIVAEGPVIAITQPESVLQSMGEWVTKQHTRSGLVDRVMASKIGETEAEAMTLTFLSKWVPANVSPMCGNTICQDRRFLFQYMPTLEKYFHYRNLDVSTIKELARYWRPELLKGFKKKALHLAMEDIKESIEELRYYRGCFFNF